MGNLKTPYVHRNVCVETKYKERSQCRGRRAVLRLRRVFRTRMLVERGDEEVRRKRMDFRRKRTGCPWSIDLPHGTRQSIVPWDSLSLSRSRRSRSLLPRLPPFSVFFPLFLKHLLVPLVHHRESRKQNGRTGGEGVAETIWTMRRDEILFQKLLNCYPKPRS